VKIGHHLPAWVFLPSVFKNNRSKDWSKGQAKFEYGESKSIKNE
jgi:hypothetical protein